MRGVIHCCVVLHTEHICDYQTYSSVLYIFYINIIGALPLQAIEVMTLRDSTYYNSLGLQSQFLLHLIVDV